jgi:NAD+ synthase
MSLAEQISAWMRQRVADAGAEGIVVGVSGGVDSACVASLAKQAMGRESVLALLLPCHSDPQDAEHGRLVTDAFGLPTITVDLSAVYDSLIATLPPTDQRLAKANLKPRLRMTTWYYFANARNFLVAGCGNKSELMIGYFTKYGDGGVDMLPLGDLYKSEVYELARELGVPEPVRERPPSAGLWPGQSDEEEMGLTYDTLERALVTMTTGTHLGVDAETLEKVRRTTENSAHKRSMPPIFTQDKR